MRHRRVDLVATLFQPASDKPSPPHHYVACWIASGILVVRAGMTVGLSFSTCTVRNGIVMLPLNLLLLRSCFHISLSSIVCYPSSHTPRCASSSAGQYNRCSPEQDTLWQAAETWCTVINCEYSNYCMKVIISMM